MDMLLRFLLVLETFSKPKQYNRSVQRRGWTRLEQELTGHATASGCRVPSVQQRNRLDLKFTPVFLLCKFPEFRCVIHHPSEQRSMRYLWLLLLVLGVFAGANSNIAIIENSKAVKAIQINPAGYGWEAFSGKHNEYAILSFNANYYYKKMAIGGIYDAFNKLPAMIYTASKRPYFVITRDYKADIVYDYKEDYLLLIQAGPTLLCGGEYKPGLLKVEHFTGTDSIRKTSHVALGVKKGKVIVAYFSNAGMSTMAKKFKDWGCEKAMKLDGGHSCFLDYKDIQINSNRGIPTGVSVF
jgi:hypothetical protein